MWVLHWYRSSHFFPFCQEKKKKSGRWQIVWDRLKAFTDGWKGIKSKQASGIFFFLFFIYWLDSRTGTICLKHHKFYSSTFPSHPGLQKIKNEIISKEWLKDTQSLRNEGFNGSWLLVSQFRRDRWWYWRRCEIIFELRFQDKGREGKSFSGSFHPRHRYRCRNQVTQPTFLQNKRDVNKWERFQTKQKKLMRCKVKAGITRNIFITFGCVITHAMPGFGFYIIIIILYFMKSTFISKEIS